MADPGGGAAAAAAAAAARQQAQAMEALLFTSAGKLDAQSITVQIWQHRAEPAFVEAFCSTLAQFSDEEDTMTEIEFYLPQLAHMVIHVDGALSNVALERFAMVVCQQSIHCALQLHWVVIAAMQDYQPELPNGQPNRAANMSYFARCARILENIEKCVVFGTPEVERIEELYVAGRITDVDVEEQVAFAKSQRAARIVGDGAGVDGAAALGRASQESSGCNLDNLGQSPTHCNSNRSRSGSGRTTLGSQQHQRQQDLAADADQGGPVRRRWWQAFLSSPSSATETGSSDTSHLAASSMNLNERPLLAGHLYYKRWRRRWCRPKRWKRRHFVIEHRVLYCFRHEGGPLRRAISLQNAEVCIIPNRRHDFYFEVHTRTGTRYLLYAETQAQMDRWLLAISTEVNRAPAPVPTALADVTKLQEEIKEEEGEDEDERETDDAEAFTPRQDHGKLTVEVTQDRLPHAAAFHSNADTDMADGTDGVQLTNLDVETPRFAGAAGYTPSFGVRNAMAHTTLPTPRSTADEERDAEILKQQDARRAQQFDVTAVGPRKRERRGRGANRGGTRGAAQEPMSFSFSAAVEKRVQRGDLTLAQLTRHRFFMQERTFVEDLTDISERMRFTDRAIRKEALRSAVRELRIPARAYLPLCNSTDVFRRVLGVIIDETRPFSTKERCPCMIVFEVEQDAQQRDVVTVLHETLGAASDPNANVQALGSPETSVQRHFGHDPDRVAQGDGGPGPSFSTANFPAPSGIMLNSSPNKIHASPALAPVADDSLSDVFRLSEDVANKGAISASATTGTAARTRGGSVTGQRSRRPLPSLPTARGGARQHQLERQQPDQSTDVDDQNDRASPPVSPLLPPHLKQHLSEGADMAAGGGNRIRTLSAVPYGRDSPQWSPSLRKTVSDAVPIRLRAYSEGGSNLMGVSDVHIPTRGGTGGSQGKANSNENGNKGKESIEPAVSGEDDARARFSSLQKRSALSASSAGSEEEGCPILPYVDEFNDLERKRLSGRLAVYQLQQLQKQRELQLQQRSNMALQPRLTEDDIGENAVQRSSFHAALNLFSGGSAKQHTPRDGGKSSSGGDGGGDGGGGDEQMCINQSPSKEKVGVQPHSLQQPSTPIAASRGRLGSGDGSRGGCGGHTSNGEQSLAAKSKSLSTSQNSQSNSGHGQPIGSHRVESTSHEGSGGGGGPIGNQGANANVSDDSQPTHKSVTESPRRPPLFGRRRPANIVVAPRANHNVKSMPTPKYGEPGRGSDGVRTPKSGRRGLASLSPRLRARRSWDREGVGSTDSPSPMSGQSADRDKLQTRMRQFSLKLRDTLRGRRGSDISAAKQAARQEAETHETQNGSLMPSDPPAKPSFVWRRKLTGKRRMQTSEALARLHFPQASPDMVPQRRHSFGGAAGDSNQTFSGGSGASGALSPPLGAAWSPPGFRSAALPPPPRSPPRSPPRRTASPDTTVGRPTIPHSRSALEMRRRRKRAAAARRSGAHTTDTEMMTDASSSHNTRENHSSSAAAAMMTVVVENPASPLHFALRKGPLQRATESPSLSAVSVHESSARRSPGSGRHVHRKSAPDISLVDMQSSLAEQSNTVTDAERQAAVMARLEAHRRRHPRNGGRHNTAMDGASGEGNAEASELSADYAAADAFARVSEDTFTQTDSEALSPHSIPNSGAGAFAARDGLAVAMALGHSPSTSSPHSDRPAHGAGGVGSSNSSTRNAGSPDAAGVSGAHTGGSGAGAGAGAGTPRRVSPSRPSRPSRVDGGITAGHTRNVQSFGESWEDKTERIRNQSARISSSGAWDLSGLIAKSNDDLRQEVFVMQLITFYHGAFADAGVAAWLFPYRILSTGKETGLIQLIQNAMSLDGLKKGETYPGSLRGHFIATYGPPTSREFLDAQTRFMESLAGYSIVCYLLGIKDRHNGNIMINTDGRLIHIDFGFVLGLAPGNAFSFERAPFKLTAEMVDMLDGENSPVYQRFIDICTSAFVVAREYEMIATTLMEIMIFHSNYPCFAPYQTKQSQPQSKLRSRPQSGKGERPLRSYPKPIADFRRRLRLDLGDDLAAIRECVANLVSRSANAIGTRYYDHFQLLTNGIAP